MSKKATSRVDSHGRPSYKHVGGYYEVTREAQGSYKNDASSSNKQDLVVKGKNSVAVKTTDKVWKELGL